MPAILYGIKQFILKHVYQNYHLRCCCASLPAQGLFSCQACNQAQTRMAQHALRLAQSDAQLEGSGCHGPTVGRRSGATGLVVL